MFYQVRYIKISFIDCILALGCLAGYVYAFIQLWDVSPKILAILLGVAIITRVLGSKTEFTISKDNYYSGIKESSDKAKEEDK